MQGSSGQRQSSSVPTLEELISSRKSEYGWSYATLAERGGGVLSAQRWQQLGTGVRIKEFPEPSTLKAMAEALDVDISVVVLAAARSTGLDVKNDMSILAQQLPSSAADLEPDTRNAIVALVRAITKRDDSSGDRPMSRTDDPPEDGMMWHGKRPEEMTDDEVRAAAAVDQMWADYVRTKAKARHAAEDWDF